MTCAPQVSNPLLCHAVPCGPVSAGRGAVIREAEEELGLTGLQGADVRFLFTAVTQAEGETAAHGHFRDNEFAHVFVAPAPELGSSLLLPLRRATARFGEARAAAALIQRSGGAAGALSLGATEVSAVALVRIADMREALAVPPPAPPAAGAGVTWRPASGGLSDGCGCGCQGSGSVVGVGPLVPRAPSYVARLEALLSDVRSEPPPAAP